MVNHKTFVYSLIVLFIASCTSEDIINKESITTLTATIGSDTRTSYTDEIDQMKVQWRKQDKIVVYSENDDIGQEFCCGDNVTYDKKTARFSRENANLSGTCTAYYPSTTDKNGTLHLDNQVQRVPGYDETAHLEELDVMKCKFNANENTLAFNHQIAVMKVELYIPEEYRSLDIESVYIQGAWENEKYGVTFANGNQSSNPFYSKSNEVFAYIAVPEGHISNRSLIAEATLEGDIKLKYTSPVIQSISYIPGNMYTANYYSFEPTVINGQDSKQTYTINGIEYPMPEAVDLGLPSGTLWADENFICPSSLFDPDNEVSYLQIISNVFSNDWHAPTEAQFRELLECNWELIGERNYKVIGFNGNSITIELPIWTDLYDETYRQYFGLMLHDYLGFPSISPMCGYEGVLRLVK